MGRDVTMNRIRDAAYSAACAPHRVAIKEAKTLAGHRFDGDTDAYVKHYPETVREAVTAIEAKFFPSRSKRQASST
jgi:hypothetical protein